MENRAKFTLFTNTKGLLSKKVSLDNGELKKIASANMYQGKFDTIDLPWEEFGSFLKGLDHNQAIGLGVCNRVKDNKPLKSGRIVKNSASWDAQNGVVSRSKDCFSWHGGGLNLGQDTKEFYCKSKNLILLDLDGLDGEDDLDDTVAELVVAAPLLKHFPMWVYASAGSNIYNGEEKLTGLTGLHIYLLLPQTIHPEEFKKYIEITMWNKGLGFIFITKSGSRLKRTPVDLAVFSPERLDFISGSKCEGGLTQHRDEPLLIDLSDGGTLPPVLYTPEEEQECKKKQESAFKWAEREAQKVEDAYISELQVATSLPKQDAKKLLKALKEKKLSGSHPIYLDSGQKISAWQILTDPEKYHKVTCADPSEPEYGGDGINMGKNKAIIYAKDYNNAKIFSHAHGGITLEVGFDYYSLKSMLEIYSEEDMSNLMGGDWLGILANNNLTQADREKLFELVKARHHIPKADVRSMFDSVAQDLMNKETNEVLHELNQKYSVMALGSKIRIVYEELEPELKTWTLRYLTKSDFLTMLDNQHVYVWKEGKKKRTKLGTAWLEWKDRRDFRGTCFMPGKDNIVEGYLNLFKGFSVDPVPPDHRECGGVNCDKKGCLHWCIEKGWETHEYDEETWGKEWGCSYGEGAKKVPHKYLNIQWYFRHIIEVITKGNVEHAKWCIAWLSDIVRNPGGDRPGTSLVFRGNKGSGKGVVFNTLGELIQGYFFPTPSMGDVVGKFNQHLQRTILLFADEAIFSGDKAGESVLKSLITEPLISIEPKGIDKISVKNFLRIAVSSNEDWVVPASRDERRFGVFDLWAGRAKDEAWFKRVANPDLCGLLWELQNNDHQINLRNPPWTPGLLNQIAQSADPIEEFLMNLPDTHPEFVGFDVFYQTLWNTFKEDYSGHRVFHYLTFHKFNKRVRDFGTGFHGTYYIGRVQGKGVRFVGQESYRKFVKTGKLL